MIIPNGRDFCAAAHIVYFIFFVKTVSKAENCELEEAPDEEAEAS